MPRLIGIAGRSASGKTTIAAAIARHFGGVVVSQDWYYRDLAVDEDPARRNWDHPDSFDWTLVTLHLQRLLAGESVWTPRHDYATNTTTWRAVRTHAEPVIVFEGMHAWRHPAIDAMMSARIYLDCDTTTAAVRRLRRDTTTRANEMTTVLMKLVTRAQPMYRRYIRPQRDTANVDVSTSEIVVVDGAADDTSVRYEIERVDDIVNHFDTPAGDRPCDTRVVAATTPGDILEELTAHVVDRATRIAITYLS